MNPGGFLFLGPSETADQPPGIFRTVDREARIYQSLSIGDKRPALPILIGGRRTSVVDQPATRLPSQGGSYADAALHRQMLERIAPPSVLVDESHRAIHLSDTAGRYLQPSGGAATLRAPVDGEVVEDVLACRLAERAEITAVSHSGLAALPPGLRGTSGLFSFELAEDVDARAFCDTLRLFKLGVSWGGHESLVVPAEVVLQQKT